jgi:hypothetical protein
MDTHAAAAELEAERRRMFEDQRRRRLERCVRAWFGFGLIHQLIDWGMW